MILDISIAIAISLYLLICNSLAVKHFLQVEKEYARCLEAAKKHDEGYFASGKLILLEEKLLWLAAHGLSWFTIHNLVYWRRYKIESKRNKFRKKLRSTRYVFAAYFSGLIGSYTIFLLYTRSTLPW